MADAANITALEEWRDVIGYEGVYEVSSHGRVRRSSNYYERRARGKTQFVPIKPRILKPHPTVGYPSIVLCRYGVCLTTYIHRLVCEAFHGPSNGRDVAHWDGGRTNNHASNLRWATREENMADKVRHGTQPRGDDLWFTKVTNEAVDAMRNDVLKTHHEWASELGVSVSLIGLIKSGKRRSPKSMEVR